MKKGSVSRGPSKDGKKHLSVFLDEHEYEELVRRAHSEFRTPSQQARAMIVAGCFAPPTTQATAHLVGVV